MNTPSVSTGNSPVTGARMTFRYRACSGQSPVSCTFLGTRLRAEQTPRRFVSCFSTFLQRCDATPLGPTLPASGPPQPTLHTTSH